MTLKDIENSSPKEMKYYEDAFCYDQQQRDCDMWQMGLYVKSAVTVSIDHAFNGNKAKSKYIEKPIRAQYFEDLTLTQEEIDNRELRKMLANERRNMALDRAKGLKEPTLKGD